MIWLADFLENNSPGSSLDWTTQCKFVLCRFLISTIRLWTREFRLLNHIFLLFSSGFYYNIFFCSTVWMLLVLISPSFHVLLWMYFIFFYLHNAKQHTIFCHFLLVLMKEGTGALFRINSCFILSIYVCDVTIMYLRAHAQIHLSE